VITKKQRIPDTDNNMKKIITICFLTFFTAIIFGQANNSAKPGSSKPFVLGIVDDIYSTQLAEKRILNIYLPEGYNNNDTIKYPVIYLLDGSADEDFIHVVGLVQFNTFEWISRMPKSIVVGIATVDRRRDFTSHTTIEADKKKYPSAGQSGKFISFLEKELQPFIEKKFKTNNSKKGDYFNLFCFFKFNIRKKPTNQRNKTTLYRTISDINKSNHRWPFSQSGVIC